jgi:hypothetical protein
MDKEQAKRYVRLYESDLEDELNAVVKIMQNIEALGLPTTAQLQLAGDLHRQGYALQGREDEQASEVEQAFLNFHARIMELEVAFQNLKQVAYSEYVVAVNVKTPPLL